MRDGPPRWPESAGATVERWLLASVAACASELLTYPLDFVKTRLQLQNELLAKRAASGAASLPPPLGMLSLLRECVRVEGVSLGLVI